MAAVRARHFKRIPEPQLTAPITFTFTRTLESASGTTTATSTPVTTPSIPSVPPPSPPTSTSGFTTPLNTLTPLPPPPPTNTNTDTRPISEPSISVLPGTQPNDNSSSGGSNGPPQDVTAVTATRKLPAGAIVGIVIGTVLIMLVIVVLLVRTRFRQNRKSKRATWLARGGIASTTVVTGKTLSSFAPAEQYPSTLPPMSTIPPTGADTYRPYPSQLTRPGDVSPGVTFARAQDNALSAYPILSTPAATYGNNTGISPAGPTPGSTAMTPRAILPVEAATVKFTFIPSLPDELSISNGEVVKVLQEFDDGWALCANGRGQQGMVPLECLDQRNAPAPDADRLGVSTMGAPRNSARASSMNLIPNRRSSGVLGTNL